VRLAVVPGELLQVAWLAGVLGLVEFGRVFDLIFGSVDVDRFPGRVDALDGSGGQRHVLAENPDTGVDNEVGGTNVFGVLVDLSDAAVGGLDLVTDEVDPLLISRGRLVLPDCSLTDLFPFLPGRTSGALAGGAHVAVSRWRGR
jgi:hypothetical protein